MTEVEMFEYVKVWLERQGYKVYGEVHVRRHDIDVVGENPGAKMNQIAIELKTSFTRRLKTQLMYCKGATYWVYACTCTMPNKKNLEWCKEKGIGVLVIKDKLQVVSHPEEIQGWRGKPHWLNLSNVPEGQVGGAPSGPQKAPAREVYHAIRAHMKANPKATWDEVYQSIPNHYAHARSMMQSMRKYAEFQRLPQLSCKGSGKGRGGRKRKPRRFRRH